MLRTTDKEVLYRFALERRGGTVCNDTRFRGRREWSTVEGNVVEGLTRGTNTETKRRRQEFRR